MLICPCIAEAKGLPINGPRSMLGVALPARNNEWLNLGPSAWIGFNANSGDIKFPMKLPIIPETHEKALIFDIRRHSCCEVISELDFVYHTQVTQAMAAGYLGGYSATMQHIGLMELKKMQKALERSHAKLTTHGTRQQ